MAIVPACKFSTCISSHRTKILRNRPIATYGQQGTLKAGLSPADVQAHAVIYMVGTSSEADPGEKIGIECRPLDRRSVIEDRG